MPFVGPQQPEVFAGFGSGLWSVAGGIAIPPNSLSDIKNYDIESGTCVRMRNGCSYYTTQGAGGRLGYYVNADAGSPAVWVNSTTITIAGIDLTGYGVDGLGGWWFRCNTVAPSSNGVIITGCSYGGGTTTLTFANNGGSAGSVTAWQLLYVLNGDLIWRHYGASSSDKTTLVAYGKRIDKIVADVVTKLSGSQTTGLQTHAVTINGVTYLCNGTDLPLRYDATSGSTPASNFLSTPAYPPVYLFSSYVDTGFSPNSGWDGYDTVTPPVGNDATPVAQYYDHARTQKGVSQGAYGRRSRDGGVAEVWAKLLLRATKQSAPLLDYPLATTKYAATDEVPYFFVPDAVASTKKFTGGTYTTNGTTTVTFSSFSPSGSSIAVGDVFIDKTGTPYRVTSGVAAAQFLVDTAIAAATDGNFLVLKNRAASASTALKISPSPGRANTYSYIKTNYSVGGTATLTGGSFDTDESAATALINPGDIILAWPDSTYSIGTFTLLYDGANQWRIPRATTGTNWVTGWGFEDAYKYTEDSSLWEFFINGAWYTATRTVSGPAITEDDIYISAAAGTFPGSYAITARPRSAVWPPYRVAVVQSKVSTTIVNLISHTGALPASSKFAIIRGQGYAGSSFGVELFKSDNNADYYSANTLYGNGSGNDLGVSGCAVVDTVPYERGEKYSTGTGTTGIPIYKFGLWHLGRFFVFNVKERDGSASYPTQYRYSEPDAPETFNAESVNYVGKDTSEGELVGAFLLQNNLYALKSNAMYSLAGDLPENISPQPIDLHTSCATWKSIVVGGGRAFWLGYDGVYMFDGVTPQLISLPIDNIIRPLPAAQKQLAAGVWRRNRYWLTVPGSAEAPTTDTGTIASRTYIYDPAQNNWTCYHPPAVGASWFHCDNQHDSGELIYLKRDNRTNNSQAAVGQYLQKADVDDTTLDLSSISITGYIDTPRAQLGTPANKQIAKYLEAVITTQTTGTVTAAAYYDAGTATMTQIATT